MPCKNGRTDRVWVRTGVGQGTIILDWRPDPSREKVLLRPGVRDIESIEFWGLDKMIRPIPRWLNRQMPVCGGNCVISRNRVHIGAIWRIRLNLLIIWPRRYVRYSVNRLLLLVMFRVQFAWMHVCRSDCPVDCEKMAERIWMLLICWVGWVKGCAV